MDCTICYGHSDLVLVTAASQKAPLLASGSKDNSIILWNVDLESEQKLELLETLKGHTGHVTALGFSTQSSKFLMSASQDRTVKCWDLASRKSKYTFQAHENDIQGLDVAPNDSCFATCSLDKTAKLWNSEDGSLLGTFKGHKRGVWRVCRNHLIVG
jgi:U3 small nucleolar RNA-associated protein 13